MFYTHLGNNKLRNNILEAYNIIEKGRRSLPLYTIRTDKNGKKWIKVAEGEWKAYTDKLIEKITVDYTNNNLEKLINNYLNEHSNNIDPDEIRKSFTPLGYTGIHVQPFKKAGDFLVEKIFERVLSEKKNKGKTLTVICGNPGAGKGTSKHNLTTKDEIIYDSALSSFSSLDEVINQGKKHGFNVRVIQVYNDPVTSFINTINRGLQIGRFVPLSYFRSAFTRNVNKVHTLLETHKGIELRAVNNEGNKQEFEEVGHEQAKKWNYEISKEQMNKILNYIEDERRKGKLTEHQVAAIIR